jgi:hypothetical protein
VRFQQVEAALMSSTSVMRATEHRLPLLAITPMASIA